jgi:alpha-glucosidase (family GH31 glycosyl hydrolase)
MGRLSGWQRRSILAAGLVIGGWLAFNPGPNASTACAQAACSLIGPGLAGLVSQFAPADWQDIWRVEDSCPEPMAGASTSNRFLPTTPALSFWDEAGRHIAATRILTTSLAAEADTDGRWELATNAGLTLTVAMQHAAPGVLSIQVTSSSGDARTLEACLPATSAEHFFGLGERFGGLDLAGHVVENWAEDLALSPNPNTSYSPAPFLLSSRGYGLFVDTTAHATFDLRTAIRRGYCVRVEAGQLRLYLIAGPHPQTVPERHARLVLPPLPPEWAFGVWKNLIGGQARVEHDLKRLQAAGVPLDAIWIYDAVDEQGNFGWPWQVYRPIAPGPYPDLAGMIRRLHGQGLKVLGYLHPFVYPDTSSFVEAEDQGYLVREPDGRPYLEPWTFTRRSYIDFSDPDAAAWWQARVTYALTEVGFDGAMLDFGEAAPVTACYANGQPGALMHNYYPMLYTQAAHMAGQAAKPGDFVFFARSGYSGSQPYTTGRFTCDQVRSWDTHRGLPSVIPAMLNGGLSGWPYWGPDIAGFFDETVIVQPESPSARAQRIEAEKELWIRWAQLGALSPTMRDMLGSQRDPVGLWTDDETLAGFRAYARLHTALKPYLYHYAQVASQRGLPIVRPLFLNYPDEAETYTLEDEYLLGDNLLVAPVIWPGRTARTVYLPTDVWRDYWSGDVHVGPGWVTIAAPLHHIPLFIREGTALYLPTPSDLFD